MWMLINRPQATAKHHLIMIFTGVIFVVTAIVFMAQGRWMWAGIPLISLLSLFVPWALERWTGVRFPFSLQILYAIFILAGPYVGGALGVYRAWPPWDTVVHFYSGIPITLAIIGALGITLHKYRLTLPVWLEVTIVITVKAFIALLWEFGEFFYDLLFDQNAQDHNLDTMTDMLAGLTTSLAIAAALVLQRKKGWFSYIGYLLHVRPPQIDTSASTPRGDAG